MQDLFSLKGRTALVTGGSRGIGEMIAEGFVRAGAKVYITPRKGSACEETAKRLSAFGECTAIAADASGATGARALADLYLARESRLDVLVNNAGAAWGEPIEGFPESGWDKVMDLNVKGSVLPDPGAACRPARRGKSGAARKDHQHCFDRWPFREHAADLFLRGVQSRADPFDQAACARAGGAEHCR